VGISIDSLDHVWFLNRGNGALPIDLTAEGDPSPALCCVQIGMTFNLDSDRDG
jgi:hypothetical protein